MNEHASAEDIARLVDGDWDDGEADRVREHLARCRSCHAAFAAAARERARLAGAAPSPLSAELGDLARSMGPGARSKASPVPSPRVALVAAAAVVLVLVAGLLWLRGGDARSSAVVVPEIVRDLVSDASAVGMVLPGGEAGAAREQPTYRSGAPRADAALDAAMETLTDRAEREPDDVDAMVWLVAAHVASSRLELARVRIARAPPGARRDPRFDVLAGVIAYRESRLGEAEHHLRRALGTARSDLQPTVLLNLAILVEETGDPDEAAELLARVAEEAAGSPMAERAEKELARGDAEIEGR